MTKIYEVAFQIGANMASSFAKTMSGASGALGELNKRMSEMGKQQAGNKRVIELRESLAKTSKEFSEARQRAAELGAAIEKSNNPTKAMRREYDQAQTAVQRAREKMSQQATTLREVTRETGSAGKSTAQLVAEQNKLATAGDRAAKAQHALQKNVAAQQANMQKRGEYRGQLLDAVGLATALGAPVKMAMEWEQRLAEFNKVAGKTQDEVNGIAMAAQEMAVATGVSREEIMGAYIAAAQAGFDESEWEKYADVAAKMGVAFDFSGEAAGEMLKAWRSGMGLSMDEAEKLAAAANHIANSMNATAADVGEVLQRQGAIMRTAGLTAEQSAAFSAALLSGGATPEQAATAAKNIMLSLTKGISATKAEAAALKALGFHDPARLAKAMQKAPEEAIMLVLNRVGGLAKEEQAAVMGQLFGTSAVGAVAPLVSNMENLANAFGLVENESQYMSSLQDEFDAMGNTTRNQAKKASASIRMIATTIGSTLLPTINSTLAQFAPMALSFGKFAEENQGVIKAIILTTAGLMAFKIAAIAGGYAFTFVRGAILSIRGALLAGRTAWLLYTGALQVSSTTSKTAIGISRAMTAAQWLLNTALLANPIGLVVAGVLALVAAGVALYKHWDVVVAFLKGAWQGLVQGLEPLKASMSGLQPIFDLIGVAVGWVSDVFSKLAGWFRSTESSSESLAAAGNYGVVFGELMAKGIEILTWPLRQLIDLIGWVVTNWSELPNIATQGIESIKNYFSNFSLFDSGKAMLTTLADGIKSAASVPVEAVKGALSKVRDMLPFSDARIGPLSELTYSGMQVLNTLASGMKMAGNEPAEQMNASLSGVSGGLSGFVDRGAGAGVGGATSINITQEINIDGGGMSAYEQAKRGASEGARDLIKQLESALNREGRLSYG